MSQPSVEDQSVEVILRVSHDRLQEINGVMQHILGLVGVMDVRAVCSLYDAKKRFVRFEARSGDGDLWQHVCGFSMDTQRRDCIDRCKAEGHFPVKTLDYDKGVETLPCGIVLYITDTKGRVSIKPSSQETDVYIDCVEGTRGVFRSYLSSH